MKKVIIVVTIVLLTFSATSFAFSNYNTSKSNVEVISYYVESGDTLWSIASDHNYKDEDVRKVIYDIKKLNGIDDVIYAGQELKIEIRR